MNGCWYPSDSSGPAAENANSGNHQGPPAPQMNMNMGNMGNGMGPSDMGYNPRFGPNPFFGAPFGL
jgi:hypothetical protein